MDLILFRHGIAQDVGPDADDHSRALTEEGVEKTTQAADGFARLFGKPDIILTSPKVRALQTAQILGKALKRTPQILDLLAQDAPLPLLRAVAQRTEHTLLLVGHEPTFSELLERLMFSGTPRGSISLRKSGCACIKVSFNEKYEPTFAQLQWLATPKLLRSAGED